MLGRIPAYLFLTCLLCASSVTAATQTFGLDGGLAALASRSQAEWVQQAKVLEQRGDWSGLLVCGQSWVQVDAHNPLAWFVQGRALGRMPEAIEAYRQNVRIAPGDVWAWNNLGNAYREMGRMRESMQAYRAAVELDPDYFQAWHNLGLTFYLTKGQAGVTQALQRLQVTDPALANVWRSLAIEYLIAREAVRVLRGLRDAERTRMFGILFAES